MKSSQKKTKLWVIIVLTLLLPIALFVGVFIAGSILIPSEQEINEAVDSNTYAQLFLEYHPNAILEPSTSGKNITLYASEKRSLYIHFNIEQLNTGSLTCVNRPDGVTNEPVEALYTSDHYEDIKNYLESGECL